MRSRFSANTVVDSKYLVPWLAAVRPLAYSPAELPARDYFFQYTWILPGIFNPKINLRGHRYFGGPRKVSAHELAAKAGRLFPPSRDGNAQVRASSYGSENLSEQHSDHYLLRGRVPR